VDVEGHGYSFRGSREMFLCEGVWWLLFEEYEMGNLRKSLDVGCSGSAYDYRDYFDAGF